MGRRGEHFKMGSNFRVEFLVLKGSEETSHAGERDLKTMIHL